MSCNEGVGEEDDSAAKAITTDPDHFFDFDPNLLENITWDGVGEVVEYTDDQLLLNALQEIVGDEAAPASMMAQDQMGYIPVQPSPVSNEMYPPPLNTSPGGYSGQYYYYPPAMDHNDVIQLPYKASSNLRQLDYSPPAMPPSYTSTTELFSTSQPSSCRNSISRKHKREDMVREHSQHSLLNSSVHSISSNDRDQSPPLQEAYLHGLDTLETVATSSTASGGQQVSYSSHHRSHGDEDGDGEEGVKAMRFGSLGRIIASTITASSIQDSLRRQAEAVPQKTQEEICEERKQLVLKMMRCLHLSDMNNLAKIIRERCCETCLLITPDIVEPIAGRGDIMMMFSLLLEMFPDGLWTTQSIQGNQFDTITCHYKFQGTRVFHYPIDMLFRQIKSHMKRNPPENGAEDGLFTLSCEKLVNEVAEHVHMPVDSAAQASSQLLENSLQNLTEDRKSEDAIQIPRRTQSLREVKTIETAVLKEGPTTYKRKWEIIFDEHDMIIRMVVMNV